MSQKTNGHSRLLSGDLEGGYNANQYEVVEQDEESKDESFEARGNDVSGQEEDTMYALGQQVN